jgi:hypothetical protein
MSLIPFDDLLSKRFDNREFLLEYLRECYLDDRAYPGVFESGVKRVFRHAGKEFVSLALAMPYLRSLGFDPDNIASLSLKPTRTRKRLAPAIRARKSVARATSH